MWRMWWYFYFGELLFPSNFVFGGDDEVFILHVPYVRRKKKMLVPLLLVLVREIE